MDNCGTCRFWAADRTKDDKGSCHCFPPAIVYFDSNTGMTFTRFPETNGIAWCGEWQPVISTANIEQLKTWAEPNVTE